MIPKEEEIQRETVTWHCNGERMAIEEAEEVKIFLRCRSVMVVNEVMDKNFGCLAVNELSKWGPGLLPLSWQTPPPSLSCRYLNAPNGVDPSEEQ
ncbi:hypothetical protein AAC387_Pa09g0767 [Persea americana]